MSLEKLFKMQELLNDAIFAKHNLTDNAGEILTCEKLRMVASRDSVGVNDETNIWLKNFLDALNDESRELREELLWKWWSKDHLDMQNIRVEIIDQLHFWICLAITSGMDAKDVLDIYLQKNKVNLERLENGYCKANKSEEDNRRIV